MNIELLLVQSGIGFDDHRFAGELFISVNADPAVFGKPVPLLTLWISMFRSRNFDLPLGSVLFKFFNDIVGRVL